jgi:hypothetical protein
MLSILLFRSWDEHIVDKTMARTFNISAIMERITKSLEKNMEARYVANRRQVVENSSYVMGEESTKVSQNNRCVWGV